MLALSVTKLAWCAGLGWVGLARALLLFYQPVSGYPAAQAAQHRLRLTTFSGTYKSIETSFGKCLFIAIESIPNGSFKRWCYEYDT